MNPVTTLVLSGAVVLFALAFLLVFLAKSRTSRAKGQSSVQDVFPVADIRGHWAYMKDGSYRAYVKWPGRNQSLDTEAEKVTKMLADASVFSAIKTTFMIIACPEKINSSYQLDLVDRAIERESRAFFATDDPAEKHLHKLRLEKLEKYFREDAIRESYGQERLSYPVYLVFCYEAGKDQYLAQEELDNVMREASKWAENPPYYCDEKEIRHLYQLYFTPGAVSDIAAPKGLAILPDYSEMEGRI